MDFIQSVVYMLIFWNLLKLVRGKILLNKKLHNNQLCIKKVSVYIYPH